MSAPQELRIDGLGVLTFGPGADAVADGTARFEDLPVVVVHGTMDRAGGFRRLQRRLEGRQVVLYDRRGYATSRDAGISATVGSQVGDLREVVEATCAAPAVVLGHSLGGLLALHLALDVPEMVAALVVWESPMAWEPWYGNSAGATARAAVEADGPEVAAEAFMRHVIGSGLWERLPAAMQAERRAEGEALVADLTLIRTPDARYDASLIDVPLVSGCGTESAPRFIRSAHELADMVPGAEFVEVEGAAHGVHLSHPQALADLVERARSRVSIQA